MTEENLEIKEEEVVIEDPADVNICDSCA